MEPDDYLTSKQLKARASNRAGMLFLVTYGGVFFVSLVTLIVCWNVLVLTGDQQDGSIFGLIFAPLVPAFVVSGVYYTYATWQLVLDEDDEE